MNKRFRGCDAVNRWVGISAILLLVLLLALSPATLYGCGEKAAEDSATARGDSEAEGSSEHDAGAGEEAGAEDEGGADGASTRTPPVGFGYGPVQGGSGGIMLLKDVVFTESGDYERLVIELTTGYGDPPREGVCMYDAHMGELPYADSEGKPVAIAGRYFFEIMLDSRTADLNLPDAPNVYEGPETFDIDMALIEGATFVTAYADHTLILLVGLDEWAPYRIEELSNPSRIVVDFAPG